MNPQLEELACLYVLDRLDPSERASFEACLPNDPQLVAFVSEIESTLDRSLRALPPTVPPDGLLAQIEARIEQLPPAEWLGRGTGSLPAIAPGRRLVPLVAQEDSPDMGRMPMPPWFAIARWGIAALIAVAVGTLAVQHLRRAPVVAGRPFVIIVGLDSNRSTLTELPLQNRPKDADASFVQLASLAEKFWEKPEGLPAKLRFAGPGGRGYTLYDPASSQGFVAVQQLPVIGRGQRYHLWMLDTATGRICEAGVLPLTESNSGLYSFSVDPTSEARSNRLDFFVTAEDVAAAESLRPRGKVVLGGQRTF